MAILSGSLHTFYHSGSEAFPNATSSAGFLAGIATSNNFISTKFTGALHTFYESGSEAFPNATSSAGFLASIATSNNFISTKFTGTIYRPSISGSEASSENVLGFTGSSGGSRDNFMFGGYLASLIRSDNDPPFVINENPASGSIDQAENTDFSFLFDDLFTGSLDFFGGSGGVVLESIHVRFKITGFPWDPAIISGSFITGYDGANSTIIPSGTLDNKGIPNGFYIRINKVSDWPSDSEVIAYITGADAFGNIHTTASNFFIIGGCPPVFGNFVSTDYTIVDGARALREYTFAGGPCVSQQAPYNLMVPGAVRLRTRGKAPYTNVKSGQSFNQKSETDFPVGKKEPS